MKIRRTRPEDTKLIADWIAADEWHTEVKPEFFLSAGHMNLCFEDNEGPVFFTTLEPDGRDIRIHIQFNGQTFRTARMLRRGFPIVYDCCMKSHARRMVFDSISPKLMNFCMSSFGFVPVEGTHDMELPLEH